MNTIYKALTITPMYRLIILFLLISIKSEAQQRTDTVKCYVQVMVPAEGAMGVARNLESNFIFLNGGMLIYTKAYAISDTSGRYIKFLNPRKKELKDIWMPDDKPVLMKKDW